MSFIPSKLGLRTHLLTQINLALVRVAGEKIYAQFAPLLSDLNYGPLLWAGQLNNKRSVVLLFLSILASHSQSFISGWKQRATDALAQFGGLGPWGLTPAAAYLDHQSCHWYGQKTLCVQCGPALPLFYYQKMQIMWLF